MLVLDTARFKYPPYWVDLDRLYDSVNSVDKDSGKKRGVLVVSKNPYTDWKMKDQNQILDENAEKKQW